MNAMMRSLCLLIASGFAIAFGSASASAVTPEIEILVSEPIGEGFRILFETTAGHTYAVERWIERGDWLDVSGEITGDSDSTEFIDTQNRDPNSTYRVRLLGDDIRWAASYLTGNLRKDNPLANAQPDQTTSESQLRTDPGIESIVILPDTQFMTPATRPPGASNRRNFLDQVEWIAENHERYNIRYVIHVGDIVQGHSEDVWRFAREAMGVLDGKVPYAIVGGNHDYGTIRSSDSRETRLNNFFHASDFEASPHFGGLFEEGKMDNSYHLLTIGNQPIMILNLEWATRDAVVDWANQVVASHPNHRIILNTHAYIYYDGTRYNWEKYGRDQWWSPKWPEHYTLAQDMEAAGGINDAEDLWQKLVSRHPNFFLTVSGHVLATGLARLESRTDAGNTVQQILVNYQWPMYNKKGSQGYLRIMQFLPDGETVFNTSYSPSLGLFRTNDLNQFSFTVQPPLNVGSPADR